MTPDGSFAYVTNAASNSVSVIDTATNTVVANVPVGTVPQGVAVTPDGAFVYVANTIDNTVSVISTAANTVTTTIPAGGFPIFIAISPDPIASLIAQVQALLAGGSLTQNQAAGLLDKLAQIQTKIDSGQTGAACNQLSSFINQVDALINNGSLTASQGQALIDVANTAKASLGC